MILKNFIITSIISIEVLDLTKPESLDEPSTEEVILNALHIQEPYVPNEIVLIFIKINFFLENR
jgi:hypothetical protein